MWAKIRAPVSKMSRHGRSVNKRFCLFGLGVYCLLDMCVNSQQACLCKCMRGGLKFIMVHRNGFCLDSTGDWHRRLGVERINVGIF